MYDKKAGLDINAGCRESLAQIKLETLLAIERNPGSILRMYAPYNQLTGSVVFTEGCAEVWLVSCAKEVAARTCEASG